MVEFVSRKFATEHNLPRYFTGKKCAKGHVSERYTANKTCCECANETANKTKAKNRKKYSLSSVEWGRKNPEKLATYQRNKNSKDKGMRNFWTSNYRQAKIDRMPSWLSAVDKAAMESVYEYCAGLRRSGLDYHVDHIVPLRGKMVSGLHVPWNLQVIYGPANMSKGNKHV